MFWKGLRGVFGRFGGSFWGGLGKVCGGTNRENNYKSYIYIYIHIKLNVLEFVFIF